MKNVLIRERETDTTMDDSKDKIIVIGRQFGSGGRKLGLALAKLLNIPYYDKVIISKVAAKYGYDPEILLKADEKKPSLFGKLLPGKYGILDSYATSPISKESLYEAQTNVIRQICQEGSCVIVGRTADYVMRDHPGLVSIFIHAPLQWRAKNVMSRGDAKSESEAMSFIKKADSERQGYYNYFTGRNWGVANNYHLTIDGSKFEVDQIAEIVAKLAELRVKG